MYVPLEQRNLIFKCRTCQKLFRMDPAANSAFIKDLFVDKSEAVAAVLKGAEINPLYCSDCCADDSRPRRKD
jgi:hypothetical protein